MITKEEYRELRKTIGGCEKVARLLGVSTSTVYRREAGYLPIDGEAEHAMRRLAEAETALTR